MADGGHRGQKGGSCWLVQYCSGQRPTERGQESEDHGQLEAMMMKNEGSQITDEQGKTSLAVQV